MLAPGRLRIYLYTPPKNSLITDSLTRRIASGDAQPRTLLHAATALAPASHKLRRRRARQHDDVHVRGERRAAGDASAHAGSRDGFPAGLDAHDDEHW